MRFQDFTDDELAMLDKAIAKWLWQIDHNGIGGPERDYHSYRTKAALLYGEVKTERYKR